MRRPGCSVVSTYGRIPTAEAMPIRGLPFTYRYKGLTVAHDRIRLCRSTKLRRTCGGRYERERERERKAGRNARKKWNIAILRLHIVLPHRMAGKSRMKMKIERSLAELS